MSGLEHRVDAVFRCRRPNPVSDEVLEQVRPGYECESIRYDLEAADAADKAAGIYRVSLDAAVEAAAKHEHEKMYGTGTWAKLFERERETVRKLYAPLVTAAVTGGAQ